MTPRFEGGEAATLPHQLLVPGERYGYGLLDAGQYGLVLGDPNASALVVIGRRDEIMAALARAMAEVDRFDPNITAVTCPACLDATRDPGPDGRCESCTANATVHCNWCPYLAFGAMDLAQHTSANHAEVRVG